MDVEKTIEFILTQQAQFSSDLSQLDRRLDRLTGNVESLAATVKGQQVQIDSIGGAIHVLIKVSDEHRQAIIRSDQAIQRSDEKSDQIKENLNALIKIVDELVRRRDNGHIQ